MTSKMDALRYLFNGNVFDRICDLIIRPPRAVYDAEVDLGPEIFRIGDTNPQLYKRDDFVLKNMREMTILCSWYYPKDKPKQPCVVYVHANCGSRLDGLEALYLLGSGVSLFTFDATGSGFSDGQYISLGFYERQDLAAVVDHLNAQPTVDGIALWGRSMGAITSIMYAAKDASIKCIVCDSPFSTLRNLIRDLVKQNGSKHIPSKITDSIVNRIRKRIVKRAAFDIDDLDALAYASKCVVPAFIFHGRDDDFVFPKHSLAVRDAFVAGPCLHHMVDGGHNDERDEATQNTIAAFIQLFLIQKPQAERERKNPPPPVVAREEPVESAPPERDTAEELLPYIEDEDMVSDRSGSSPEPQAPRSSTQPRPISFSRPLLRDASAPTQSTTDDST